MTAYLLLFGSAVMTAAMWQLAVRAGVNKLLADIEPEHIAAIAKNELLEVMAKQVLEALSGDAIRELRLSPQTHFFIEKMMAKEKEIRFQDPDQLVAEIEHHLVSQEREKAAEEESLNNYRGR